jgi:hypothetical protein
MEQDEEPPATDANAVPPPLSTGVEPPEEEEIQGEADTKKVRQSPKSTWILTYGASGPYITPQMLTDLGKIQADECHSTKDRVMNFTYIHLTKRVRQTSIEKFMAKANEVHGIVKNEIFGYDAIASDARQGNVTPIEEHAGFQMLVRHFNSKNPAFIPWTDGEPILKRGRILKAADVDTSRPNTLASKTRAQLIAYAERLEQRLKEADTQGHEILARYNAVSSERASLRTENVGLRSENVGLRSENVGLRSENAILKRKIQDMENTQPSSAQGAAGMRVMG